MKETDSHGKTLNICQFVPYDLSPSAGGVKVHAVKLADALRQRGHRVTVAGPASKPLVEPHQQALCGTFNVRGNGSDNLIGLCVSPWSIKRFLRQNRFDLLHFHEPQMPLVGYWLNWLAGSTPKVATFHGYSEKPDWALGRKISASLVLGSIHQGIAVSKAAAEQARRAFCGGLEIVPNGVDISQFRPQTRKARETLNLICVGRVHEPRKAFDTVQKILLQARKAGLALSLDVVGEGQLDDTWASVEGVRHHRELDPRSFAELMANCDVLLAPSRGQESFGMILVEAMACGLEIVCSDIAGFRGTTEGTDAQLSCPADVAGFVASLQHVRRLSDNQRQERSQRYRRHAESFAWERVADGVERIYRRACPALMC